MTATPGASLTDLYQLTMLQAYLEHGLEDIAVFEFFVRRMPQERGFLVAAGLESALRYLEEMRFSDEELDWIADHPLFSSGFAARLGDLRFTGDVHAMPEGTICFADEPLLRITAPLPEAQLVESRLINLLHFQTLIASKAVRGVLTAPDKLLVDFGMRRAHGAEAALLASRASYLAGFTGTSNVRAGIELGIPVFGTMAHSFIELHDDESLAFERFARTQPDNVILLIDTYDTEDGARRVVELAPKLRRHDIRIKGVRLDSGDLAEHARKVRGILNAGDCADVSIFCSGGLDEHLMHELLTAGAPIDGFGVGTRLTTSADVPYLDCAYKLTEFGGIPRRKRSEGKATLPGRKQVFRQFDEVGTLRGDVLTLEGDSQRGKPLLHRVMRDGRRVNDREPLDVIRARLAAQVETLSPTLRSLRPERTVSVEISPALESMVRAVDARTGH